MTCPYCQHKIDGVTGLDEAVKFEVHLGDCQQNPNNIVLSDGQKTVVTPKKIQQIEDALSIRAESGQ